MPVLGVPCISGGGGINPSSFGGSTLGLSTIDSSNPSLMQGFSGAMQQISSSGSPLQVPQDERNDPSPRAGQSPQHLQGTIV